MQTPIQPSQSSKAVKTPTTVQASAAKMEVYSNSRNKILICALADDVEIGILEVDDHQSNDYVIAEPTVEEGAETDAVARLTASVNSMSFCGPRTCRTADRIGCPSSCPCYRTGTTPKVCKAGPGSNMAIMGCDCDCAKIARKWSSNGQRCT